MRIFKISSHKVRGCIYKFDKNDKIVLIFQMMSFILQCNHLLELYTWLDNAGVI